MNADETIARERQRVYGDWRANMAATSRQLDGLLMQWQACNGDDTPLPDWWTQLTMCAVKLNRIASGVYHPDNFADTRNYLAFVEAVQREDAEALASLGQDLAEKLAGTLELDQDGDGQAVIAGDVWFGWAPVEPLPEEFEHLAELMVLAAKAALRSPDPSTKVGAVLLTDGAAVEAYNAPVVGCDPERLEDREWKMAVTRHAEVAAIERARCQGHDTVGATLVCPWAACPACARAIVAAGVGTVVVSRVAMEATPIDWRRDVELGLQVLRGAGVLMYAAEPVGMEMLMRGARVAV